MLSKVSSLSPHSRKPQAPRKDKPTCSHCGIIGHTMEKCYRLHDYPPGFKFTKNKGSSHSANHVQDFEHQLFPHLSITQEQCQQLLALIKCAFSDSSPAVHQVGSSPHQDHLFSKVTGNILSSTLNKKHSVFYSSRTFHIASTCTHKRPWLIDTSATDHMVNYL
jgi:hypothetical protein